MSECDAIQRVTITVPQPVQVTVGVQAPTQVTVRERVGIPGKDGTQGVEIRIDNNILQIRHPGETAWTDLKDFSQPVWGGKFGP